MKKNFYLADVVLIIVVLLLFTKCGPDKPPPPPDGSDAPAAPKPLSVSIGPVYPHDTSFFTEGLLFYKGELYESAGDPDYTGKSRLMKIDLKSGKPVLTKTLDKKYFAEGIVILRDTVYQLTYK